MAGVFDRLQKQLEETDKEGGMSMLDLADLPPALRKIMRIMLRQTKMNYDQLLAALEEAPKEEQVSRADLDAVLEKLASQAWLIQIGQGEHAIYKVNLRRKAGSHLPANIWQNLDSKLKG